MAEDHFRVDLGYEEMGFRSQLFFNEFDSAGGFNSLRRSYRVPHASGDVDVLSDQFSSMSLLRPKPRTTPSLPSSLQRLRPHGIIDPFYELHLSRLCKKELQSLQDIRAMVLQRQESQLNKGSPQNGNASVGTGVFHPLHFYHRQAYNKTTCSLQKRNQKNRNRNQNEKKLLAKERKGVMSNTTMQQQQECHYHLPSDMDFSKAWTF